MYFAVAETAGTSMRGMGVPFEFLCVASHTRFANLSFDHSSTGYRGGMNATTPADIAVVPAVHSAGRRRTHHRPKCALCLRDHPTFTYSHHRQRLDYPCYD